MFVEGIHVRFLLAHKFLVSLQEKAAQPISVVVSTVVVVCENLNSLQGRKLFFQV